MSEHVRRADPSNATYYIILMGALSIFAVFLYESFTETRRIYVNATPSFARLYIEDRLACEAFPCKITQQYLPKNIWVRAENHYSEKLPISLIEYFTEEDLTFDIHLRAFPEEEINTFLRSDPQAPDMPPSIDLPLDSPGQINPPEVEKETLPTPKPVRRPLPRECRETRQERQLAKNRAPVICHSLADQDVIFDVPGLCYASFWVSVDGRPKDLQGFGCRHDVLLETARRAFKSRRYLPGLEDGRPVQKAVDAEIHYGPKPSPLYPAITDHSSQKARNSDAKVLSCPSVKAPRSMKRSGHCVFEFDLSVNGQVTLLRQVSCTHAELLHVTSSAFKKCEFQAATTDKSPVARPYMKHQIDIDVFDKKGEKIPVHPSFSASSPHKPNITE